MAPPVRRTTPPLTPTTCHPRTIATTPTPITTSAPIATLHRASYSTFSYYGRSIWVRPMSNLYCGNVIRPLSKPFIRTNSNRRPSPPSMICCSQCRTRTVNRPPMRVTPWWRWMVRTKQKRRRRRPVPPLAMTNHQWTPHTPMRRRQMTQRPKYCFNGSKVPSRL